MSNDNPLPLNELQHSLKSVQQLQRSALTSVLLMLVGVAVIIGSFLYSITRLRPLESQIAEKQQNINGLDEKITNLQQQIEVKRKELQNKEQELLRRIQDLLKLNSETEDKEIAKRPAISTTPSTTPGRAVIGFAYYGIRNEDGSWQVRYLRKDSGNATGLPQVGDEVTSISPVNMRQGYIEYDPVKGWTNKPVKGVIRPNQRFELLEVKQILGSFIWVKLKSIK